MLRIKCLDNSVLVFLFYRLPQYFVVVVCVLALSPSQQFFSHVGTFPFFVG